MWQSDPNKPFFFSFFSFFGTSEIISELHIQVKMASFEAQKKIFEKVAPLAMEEAERLLSDVCFCFVIPSLLPTISFVVWFLFRGLSEWKGAMSLGGMSFDFPTHLLTWELSSLMFSIVLLHLVSFLLLSIIFWHSLSFSSFLILR